MTKASDAYQEAQRLIAAAAISGATTLSFNTPETRALTRLPPEIATLTALTTLELSGTKVSDLTPIAALTALTRLDLIGTGVSDLTPIAALTDLTTLYLSQTGVSDLTPIAALTGLTRLHLTDTGVSDLRPLRKLEKLANEPEIYNNGDHFYGGLIFTATPACQDARIARIAEIRDPATRARTLFDYLQDWLPPGEVNAPEPDLLLSSILINGQLELAPDPPTEAEQQERLKRALHERLQEKAPDLARAAGNQFPRLAAKSRVIAELVAKPFTDLDLLSIHLEVEDLAERAGRGMEDGVPYSEEVANALGDVTRLGPGLTLGHPEVDLFIIRLRDAREHPAPDFVRAIHTALSQAIFDDPAAHGERSRAMEARIASLEDTAARQAGWLAKHRGLLWVLGGVGALAGVVATNVSSELIVQNLGPSITAFVRTNIALLLDLARTYGPSFGTWFSQAISVIATIDPTTIRDRLK